MAAPVLELGAIEGRMGELLARYCDLDDVQAYAIATVGLSDWQVERAIVYVKAGLYWEQAIYEASLDREPPPVPVLAPAPRLTLVSCAKEPPARKLSQAIAQAQSYYTLVRYVGNKRAKVHPIIGVMLTCPGYGYAQVRWNLARSGILPRSRHWRDVRNYLEAFQAIPPRSVRSLEKNRVGFARLEPRWSRLLALSPVYTAIGDPKTLLKSLVEEEVMSNKVIEAAEERMEDIVEVFDTEREAKREANLCASIKHLAPHMSLADVETFMKMLTEQTDEDAYPTMVTLMFRLVDIVTKRSEPAIAARVERIRLAAERVVKW